MKTSMLMLMGCFCILIMAVSSYGASKIVLDNVSGTWSSYPDIIASTNCQVTFTFRLTNTDGNNITYFTNGFRVYTKRNGVLTNNYTPIIYDTIPIGWSNYFDGGTYINTFGVNGSGMDTIGIGSFCIAGSGFPDWFDQPVWWIATTPTVDGDTLCIDSTYYPPSGTWRWGTSGGATVYPDWGGPYCFKVQACPCGYTVFDNCPSYLTAIPNQSVEYTFYAHHSLEPWHPVDFEVLEGPGTITEISDTSAIWSFQPTTGDVGTVKAVTIVGYSNGVCGSCNFNVYIVDVLPEFTGGCNDTTSTTAGETAVHNVTANINPENMYIADVDRTPSGNYNTNDSGLITFNTDSNDRGHYTFEVCIPSIPDTICCPVTFLVNNAVCLDRGNVDGVIGVGGAVDVADLSYLVNFLFQNGPPPPCTEEGNVDNITGVAGPIDVADLSYLVAYLFQSGPTPPPCP